MNEYRLKYEQLRAFRQSSGLCRCGREREDSTKIQCARCRAADTQRQKHLRKHPLIEDGKCSTCRSRERDAAYVTCAVCRERARNWKKREMDRRKSQRLCRECAAPATIGYTRCDHCRLRNRLSHKSQKGNLRSAYQRRRADAKAAIFAHYGQLCKCCGITEPEFLTIDHVHNDGAEHRRQIGGRDIYGWIVKAGFPDWVQILCANCNGAKGRTGICPHEVQRRRNNIAII
jgi:hypothetical protein